MRPVKQRSHNPRPRNLRLDTQHPRRAGIGTRAIGMTLVETLVTFVILGFLTTLILQAVGFFAARYEGVQRVHRVAALESLRQNWFATSVRGFVPYGVHARRFQGQPTRFEGITLEPLHAQPGTPVTVRWSIAEDAVLYTESPAPTAPAIQWTVRSNTYVRGQSATHEFRPTRDITMTSREPDTHEFRPTRDITMTSPDSDTHEFGLTRNIEMTSRLPAASDPAARQGDLAFHYADAAATWWDHWPPRPGADPVLGATPEPDPVEPASVDDLIEALAQSVTAAPTEPLVDPANDWTPRLVRLFSAEEGTIWLARVEPSARPLLTDVDVE